jgi:hypothetical protein
VLFCTPKYLAVSSTLISRFSPKRTGIRTPPYKLSGLLCPAGLWHLATTFVGLSHTQAVTAKPRNHDRPASDSGGSSAGAFCGAVNITGKFQSTAETAKLAAVYKLMLRGQCFLSSCSEGPKGYTQVSLAPSRHHIRPDLGIPSSVFCLVFRQVQTD